jgi:hypothetical protein
MEKEEAAETKKTKRILEGKKLLPCLGKRLPKSKNEIQLLLLLYLKLSLSLSLSLSRFLSVAMSAQYV